MAVTQNPLYHFIAKGTFQPENCIFRAGYVMINLKHSAEKMSEGNTTYTIASHHLTFSETQDDNNPKLGQYHYTADLRNAATGEIVKVHVYFQQDQTKEPTIGTVPSGSLSANMREHIIQHAIKMSAAILPQLRKKSQANLDAIAKRYEVLDAKLTACSERHAFTSDEYQTQLHETMSVLSELAPYNSYYAKIYNIFSGMKPSSLPSHMEVKQEAEDKSASEIDVPKIEVVDDFPTSSKLNTRLITEIETIKQIREKVIDNKNKNLKPEFRLKEVVSYFDKSSETSFLLEENDGIIPQNKRNELCFYLTDSLREGIKLLSGLVAQAKTDEDFEKAKALQGLVPHLPRTTIDFALKSGNAKLLDFLLTHDNLAINTLLIEDLSPVMYCFTNHVNKPGLTNCLSVLIKHQASLMIDTVNGLPIAHHILAVMGHPLRAAMVENKGKTLDNLSFMKYLLACEKAHLSQITLENANHPYRAKLLYAIEERELAIMHLSTASIATSGRVSSTFAAGNTIANQVSSETKQELQSMIEDPDIVNLRKEVRQEMELLFKVMKPRQRDIMLSRSIRFKEHLEKGLLDERCNLALSPAFKANAIVILQLLIEHTKLTRHMIEYSQSVRLQAGLIIATAKKNQKELEKIAKKLEDTENKLKIAMSRSVFDEPQPGDEKEANAAAIPKRDQNISTIILTVHAIKSLEAIKSKDMKKHLNALENIQMDKIMLEEELSVFDDDEIKSILISIGGCLTREQDMARQIAQLDKLHILNFFAQRALSGNVHINTEINGKKKAVIFMPDKKSYRMSSDTLFPITGKATLFIMDSNYSDNPNSTALVESSPNQIAAHNQILQARTKKYIKSYGLESFVKELEEMHKKGDENSKSKLSSGP